MAAPCAHDHYVESLESSSLVQIEALEKKSSSEISAHRRDHESSEDLLHIGEKKLFDSLLVKKSKPFKVGPSSVLNRVKSFLPQLEQANKRLDEKIAEGSTADLDIENVQDCEGPIIEMNLALCPHDASSDDEDVDADYTSGDEECGSNSDIEADSSCDKSDFGEVTVNTLKLPSSGKKLKDGRTLIEELPGTSHISNKREGERT